MPRILTVWFSTIHCESRRVRAAWVAGACVCAFWLRSAYGLDIVFQEDGFVNLQNTDAWYHFRIIENLLAHFPWRITFDPYGVYPGGQTPRFAGLYDLAVGAAAWALGWGAPSSDLAKTVAAWSPVALAGCAPAAVYRLARVVVAPGAAIAAAWWIAVLPGNWLEVSRLGFADHHVAEVLFSTLMLWGLMRSYQGGGRRYALAAGLALGAYLASWATGALAVAVVVGWACLYALATEWRAGSSGLVLDRTALALAIAWAFTTPFAWHRWSVYTHLALGAGLAGLVAFRFAAARLRRRRAPGWALSAMFAGLAVSVVLGAAAWQPRLFEQFLGELQRFQPTERMQTLPELRPILTYYGSFGLRAVWEQFALSWLFAIPALAWLAWSWRRDLRPERSLFLFWTLFMLAMTLSQIRTAYYLAVCFAILGGFGAWKVFIASRGGWRYVTGPLLAITLLGTSLSSALAVVKTDGGLSGDMQQALRWLAEQTPEPLGDPGKHFELYDRQLRRGDYRYPESVYTVLCWWDLGHAVNAVARRIPSSNGFQSGGHDSARFYLATSEAEALDVADRVRARYVLLEPELPIWSFESITPTGSKFHAFPLWTGGEKERRDYFEVFVRDESDEPVVFYYPAYYRSMMARMYLFDGRATEPSNSAWVVEWRDDAEGGRRRIVSERRFADYEEAARYVAERPGEPLALGGFDPERSCVPLEPLERFRLVFNSKPGPLQEKTGRATAVKIFERTDGR